MAFLDALTAAYPGYSIVGRETGLMYEELGDKEQAAVFYEKARKQGSE